MPGLIWFGRRWNMATDEFVFGGFFAGVAHGTWCFIAFILFFSWYNDSTSICPSYKTRQAFAICCCLIHLSLSVGFLALSYLSSLGLVFELSERRNVPVMLSCLLPLIILQFGLCIWGTVLLDDFTPDNCTDHHPLVALTVAVWLLWLLPSSSLLFSWDFGGRSSSTQNRDDAYDRTWLRRCRWMCCCVFGRKEPEEGSHEYEIFESVSHTMSAIFQNIDLTPSDVAEGLVLLNLKQTAKRHNLRMVTTNTTNRSDSPPRPRDTEHLRRMLEYSKYYMAAYGALIYWWMYLFTGPARLLYLIRCRKPFSFKSVGEGCLRFDSTALLAFTKLRESEVLFANFGSKMCLPGFFVAMPENNDEIIIAVRGTLSLHDCVTDAYASPASIDVKDLPGQAFVHEGMLLSSRNIIKMLKEEEIMPEILSSGKRVIVCGHSLGAGTATILTIVLREEFPELRDRIHCLAYSPPGGLLSRNLSSYTETFIECCVVGKDVVPRLSQVTMEELRNGMVTALAQCRRTKADVMQHLARCGSCARSSDYYFDATEHDAVLQHPSSESMAVAKALLENRKYPESACVRLFPPDNILHLVPIVGGKHHGMYATMRMAVEELQEVLVTPSMIGDHFPDKVLVALQSAAQLLPLCSTVKLDS